MRTLENFASGILGVCIIIFGCFILFANAYLGIFIILIGFYLKYESETYVHK